MIALVMQGAIVALALVVSISRFIHGDVLDGVIMLIAGGVSGYFMLKTYRHMNPTPSWSSIMTDTEGRISEDLSKLKHEMATARVTVNTKVSEGKTEVVNLASEGKAEVVKLVSDVKEKV